MINVKDDLIGKAFKCPKCGHVLRLIIKPNTAPAKAAKVSAPAVEEDVSSEYEAFISYRHVEPDRGFAKWLHSSLESYRVPSRLRRDRGIAPRIKRVFRDEEELAASSDLKREVELALRRSRFLIVICSPRTPSSEWVNKEVLCFREWNRDDRILALLIEGEPAEAFPRSSGGKLSSSPVMAFHISLTSRPRVAWFLCICIMTRLSALPR